MMMIFERREQKRQFKMSPVYSRKNVTRETAEGRERAQEPVGKGGE